MKFSSSFLARLVFATSIGTVSFTGVGAHAMGTDMMKVNGAMTMDPTAGGMVPWLHFIPGDVLWFYGWVPTDKGSLIGTCIGLFLLGLLDRWVAAWRATMETQWIERNQVVTYRLALPEYSKSSTTSSNRFRGAIEMHSQPSIFKQDITRGVIHAGQAVLHFTIMLAIMTYQAAFIIATTIGLGVGEILFGRFCTYAAQH